MPTMQSLFKRHHTINQFTEAMEQLRPKDVADIDYNTLTAPGFGTTSLIYTTIVLAKEVARLQNIIDNATAFNAALQAAASWGAKQ